MDVKKYIKFLAILIIFDYAYLSVTKEGQTNFYEKIQHETFKPNLVSASLFYILAPIAFIIFVNPLSRTKKDAAMYGAAMGFFMFMTYDLTCKTIFKRFTWNYAIKDIIWGTMLFAIASYICK